MTWQVVVQPAAVVGALTVICGAIYGVVKKVRPVFRKLTHFLEDWNGEPPRDGFDGRPGVMARLASVEHELKTNGGGSLKDQTNRIEGAIHRIEATQIADANALSEAVAERKADMAALDSKLTDHITGGAS